MIKFPLILLFFRTWIIVLQSQIFAVSFGFSVQSHLQKLRAVTMWSLRNLQSIWFHVSHTFLFRLLLFLTLFYRRFYNLDFFCFFFSLNLFAKGYISLFRTKLYSTWIILWRNRTSWRIESIAIFHRLRCSCTLLTQKKKIEWFLSLKTIYIFLNSFDEIFYLLSKYLIHSQIANIWLYTWTWIVWINYFVRETQYWCTLWYYLKKKNF